MKWRWILGLALLLVTAGLFSYRSMVKPRQEASPSPTNSLSRKTNAVNLTTNRLLTSQPGKVPLPSQLDKSPIKPVAGPVARGTNLTRPRSPLSLATNLAKTNAASKTARNLGTNQVGKIASTNAAAGTSANLINNLKKSLSTIAYGWYGFGALLLLGGAYGLFRWSKSKPPSTSAPKSMGLSTKGSIDQPSRRGGLVSPAEAPAARSTALAKSPSQELSSAPLASTPAPLPAIPTPKRRKAPGRLRFTACNVLRFTSGAHQLWQFDVAGQDVTLHLERAATNAEALPKKSIAKGAQSLWSPRLNVLWLEPDQVFLRVIHLPASEPEEVPAMVELQLEKLSPMPVAQIVWSFEVVSQTAGHLQTIIVIIASRNMVEEFLGRLENQGYLADRLELPQLHHLLTTPIEEDGVWFYPDPAGLPPTCLVAWWHQKTLCQVNCLRLSTADNWPVLVNRQLTQIAWAGEMEGWLASVPRCHLAADPRTAEQWKPVLEEWSGQPVRLIPQVELRELASLNVQRLAKNQSQANLLPVEFATRYRQQFIDSLWMGGLGALLVVYLAGLFLYFAAVQVFIFQRHQVDVALAALKPKYTTALQTKARIQVMQDQMNLKYAGLECWKAVAELLPVNLTLTDLSLQQGKTLTIHGSAPSNEVNSILEYNRNLSQHRVSGTNGLTLFSIVRPPNSNLRPGSGNELSYFWDFSCDLRQQY